MSTGLDIIYEKSSILITNISNRGAFYQKAPYAIILKYVTACPICCVIANWNIESVMKRSLSRASISLEENELIPEARYKKLSSYRCHVKKI